MSSILKNNHLQYDYIDCFQGVLIAKNDELTISDACIAFLSSVRETVQKLSTIKAKIVSMVGLKAKPFKMQKLDKFKYEAGEQLGILKVYERSDNEITLGSNGTHFNFRISLILGYTIIDKPRTLSMSTRVVFNNWLGRFYFSLIKPLHLIFSKILLGSTIRKLERKALLKDNNFNSI
ncbi:DUF2867 domain-containing protein [Parapedobacter tibetensis]|uniref:DUF2867 domain-containing protein n=1 Tax=Parapedobacter tibetensis TaxID=2972951 RepID=UPI00214DD14D|nr:DUF2867 domain-containing protein [Parapedobacter tibetensis]